MKIKTWVKILVFLSLTIILGVGFVNFSQKNQINKSIKKMRHVNEIVKVVNQRMTVANNYLNYHTNEAIIQWQVMYDVAVRLLQSKQFNQLDEQNILEEMREDNVIINQIFTELMILQEQEKLGIKDKTIIQAEENKLKNELLNKGETIITGAYRLAEISQQNSVIILSKANVFTLGSISVLIILILFMLIFFRLKIVASLIELNEGLKIIASGNLDYKIKETKKDEIGQIINSFNEMTDKLKQRTTAQEIIAEKLRKSNKELQQFAYIASHDLQEPLRRICSYLQLIESRYKNKLDKDADEFIAFAVEGTKKLQTMINDILLFSNIETQGAQFFPVNFEDVLKQAKENLQDEINENKAIITHDPLPTVRADHMQMVMLFRNLLSNAIKFNNKKTPIIHISAKHYNKEWQFSVTDKGIGIDPKDQEKLFVIFKRLVGTEYPGIGTGLAISKRIVDRHHGKIWVESELGKGAIFYFTIPDEIDFTSKEFLPSMTI